MTIISKPAGTVLPPISKSVIAAGTVSAPISKSVIAAGTVSAPISKSVIAAGTVSAPVVKSTIAAGTVSAPVVKSTIAAGTVAAPITKTPVSAAAFPRTLTPLVSLDFANDIFAQNGVAKALSTITTFTRASTATYIGRDLNAQGQYDYTVKTASAGALRIEYDAATGKNLGALIEGGSTNLFLRSEEFDNASWQKTNCSILLNSSTSPDSALTADKLQNSLSNAQHYIIQSGSLLSSQVYTYSIFVKASGASIVQLSGAGVGNTEYVNFNLSTGEIGNNDLSSSTATISPLPGNWFRCSLSFAANSTGSGGATVSVLQGDIAVRIPFSTGVPADNVFIWGAQLEVLHFASSYIKTEGSAVSRSADNLSMPSTGNFNDSEYTLSAKGNSLTTSQSSTMVVVSDNTSTNKTQIMINSSNLAARFYSVSDGSAQFFTGGGEMTTNAGNRTLTFASNNANGYFNGEVVFTDTSNLPVTDVSIITFGRGAGSENLYGHIGKFQSYNKALTAQEVGQL